MARWSKACGLVLFLSVASVGHAQYGATGFSYGRGVGFGAGYPLGPTSMPLSFGGPRVGWAGGQSGSRSVTWYTPGVGYASNLQTGVPWHGQMGSGGPRSMQSASYPYSSSMLVRQERVRERIDAIYAMKQMEIERRRDGELVLPASAKSKGNKGKKTTARVKTPEKMTVAQREAISNIPNRAVPTEPGSVLEAVGDKEPVSSTSAK